MLEIIDIRLDFHEIFLSFFLFLSLEHVTFAFIGPLRRMLLAYFPHGEPRNYTLGSCVLYFAKHGSTVENGKREHLKYYFDQHVCLSMCLYVRLSVRHNFFFAQSINVTN